MATKVELTPDEARLLVRVLEKLHEAAKKSPLASIELDGHILWCDITDVGFRYGGRPRSSTASLSKNNTGKVRSRR